MSTEATPEPVGDIIGTGTPASNPNPEAAITDSVAAPNFDELPKWTAALTPDTRTAHFEDLKGINGPEDITRMAFELKSKNAEGIFRPAEDASQEDVNTYLEKIGVPLDKSNYEFDVPEGSGVASMVDGLKELAFTNRISTEQAGAISSFLVESEKAAVSKLDAEMDEMKAESERSLRGKYGDKYDAKVARANAMMSTYGTPEFQSFLDETKLGNNSEFIDMMMQFSELLSDDLLNSGVSSGPRIAGDYYSFPNTPGME